MSHKEAVVTALATMNRSLAELEQAALVQEANTEIIVRQGQSTSTTLGELVAAVGTLNDRLGRYLDDSDRQGARINTLEREVRELRDGR